MGADGGAAGAESIARTVSWIPRRASYPLRSCAGARGAVKTAVRQFFFDTDFLLGTTVLSAEEAAPGRLGVTRQASKIAARLRPEAKDLRMRAMVSTGENEGSGASARRVPASGYVGPYPLREREAGGEEDE